VCEVIYFKEEKMAKIKYYGSGNWFGLPEFGITELFGGNPASVQKLTGSTNKNTTSTKSYSSPTTTVPTTTTKKIGRAHV
jgi:hypothetical protein